jgi:aminopeptidase C
MENGITYTVEKLSIKDAIWYGANVECYIVRYSNGFAPIEKFASLDSKGRYTHNSKKGYIHGNGNLGTHAMLLTNLKNLN